MNSAVPFWFQSADEGGQPPVPPAPGMQVGNSLRFCNDGNTNPANPSFIFCENFVDSTDVWTASWWMKKTTNQIAANEACTAMSWHTNATNQTMDEFGFFVNPNVLSTVEAFSFWAGGNTGNFQSQNSFNDDAAWFHTVWRSTSNNNVRCYINGVEITNWRIQANPTSQTFVNHNCTCSWGGRGQNVNPSPRLLMDGYLSEIRFVDNQSLGPEAFGQFNTDGVWQPRRPAVIDTTIGDYGRNGYYLPLSNDSVSANPNTPGQILCTDEAPIDANHSVANNFTGSLNGFDITNNRQWEDFVFSTTDAGRNWNSTDQNFTPAGNGPANAFDGNQNTDCEVAQNSTVIFRPDPPISGVTQVEVFAGAGCAAYVNQVQEIAGLTPTRTTVYSGAPITLETFGVDASARPRFSQLFINGQILLDNEESTFDLVEDSPSNNYSILNTSYPDTTNRVTYTSGGLRASITANDAGAASAVMIPPSGGKYYCEVTIQSAGANAAFGLARTPGGAFGAGAPRFNGYYCPVLNQAEPMIGTSTNNAANPAPPTAAGTVYGMAYDSDANELYISANGTYLTLNGAPGPGDPATNTNPFYTATNIGALAPAASGLVTFACYGASNGTCEYVWNFGQQPFNTAAPAGYGPLLATGLPDASIQDGRDQFRIVQAGGAFVLDCASGVINDQHGSAGFASGLWVIKDLANDNQWQWIDSVTCAASGTDVASLCPQQAGVGGGGFNNYAAPAGNSVGYCWNYTSGNTDNGFTIVRYTGDGNVNTAINHDLGAAPDCIITTVRQGITDTSAGMVVFVGVPGSEHNNLNLATTNAGQNAVDTSNGAVNTATATQFTFATDGDLSAVNENGQDYTAYLWRSVSGYSQIGFYDGNNNADGVYVECGFAPSMVIIKRFDNADHWTVRDGTALDDGNPCDVELSPDQRTAENATNPQTKRIDLRSNGFKLLTNDSRVNGAETYFFMAFACSPFGGGNVWPKTGQLIQNQATPADGRAGVVSNSLRFRGDNNQRLTRTFTQAGSATTFTASVWFKYPNSNTNIPFLVTGPDGNNDNVWEIQTGGLMKYEDVVGGSFVTFARSTATFRDPNAWYHTVFVADTTNATAANRIRIFINGIEVVMNRLQGTWPVAQNFQFNINGAVAHAIMAFTGGGGAGQGYLADYYFVDDQVLMPTAFAEYNAEGVWVPRQEADITTTITNGGGYGDTGFKLIFNQSNIAFGDTPVLQDQSGNNNDWEMINFELLDEDDPDFDLMVDGPSTNFSTINVLNVNGPAFNPNSLDGNLTANLTNNQADWAASCGVSLASGQYYYESTYTQNCTIGVCLSNVGGANSNSRAALTCQGPQASQAFTQDDLDTNGAGNTTTFNLGLAPQANGTVGCRVDTVNRTLAFTFDGTTYSNNLTYAEPPDSDGAIVPYLSAGVAQPSNQQLTINFGQQPFEFAVPNGFESLQCRNLPAATITDPGTQFRAITSVSDSTGYWFAGPQALDADFIPADSEANEVAFGQPTGTLEGKFIIDFGQEVTNAQVFVAAQILNVAHSTSTDGLTWTAASNITFNTPSTTVNGTYRYISINNGGGTWSPSNLEGGGEPILTQAQTIFNTGLWWIKPLATGNHQLVDSIDGATSCRQLNAGTTGAYTAPTGNSAAWCWNWNQADPQTNGFNIVDFDVSGASVTLDTGLDNPEWIIYYSSGSNTFSGFRVLGNGFFELNTTQRFLSGNTIQWQTGANAGEVVLDGARISGAGKLFAWQSIPNYSAFGVYTGNNDNNGSFIYTGFRPAYVLLRPIDSANSWLIMDSTRSPFNPVNATFSANNTTAEDFDNNRIDILSNGFKNITNLAGNNTNQDYVYCAFAESPFGGNNVQPANAR